ncbi:branched-chain amino acid ABC transporter substrate-binding protein [Ventosimonas gracilis]|uniref:branched-chain amino acid ABC transporter substrate-binding protein n=1 Tax=Ventosimonas gracilis TaxID=1680762 RepID=UPI0009A2449E|nr:branched-chain amino acid ABC transporter substrate-binding protein [Ventosimonas gracilis]
MNKTVRNCLLTIGTAALALGIAACSKEEDKSTIKQEENKSTIKIGLGGPVTGPLAEYGEQVFNGARMAIDQINAKGGVLGRQLEAVVYDDACDPKQAVAVANKAVGDKIAFVVGHTCSSSTQPASDIYEDEGILMVTSSATAPEITARGHKLIFRTIGLDNMQGPAAGRYIADKAKPKNLAVIHDKQQYGEGIASEVKRTAEEAGLNVVVFEGVNAGDRDFASLITRLRQADVDFVYFGGYHPEMGLLMRQSRERGLEARFMGPEGAGNTEITAIAGAASEGMLVTLPKSSDQDPANAELVAAFKERNQDPSGPFVLLSYAAAQVIAEGIAKAGTTDTTKVAEALRSNSFTTPVGVLEFAESGDLKDFEFEIYEWHQDGSKTLAP